MTDENLPEKVQPSRVSSKASETTATLRARATFRELPHYRRITSAIDELYDIASQEVFLADVLRNVTSKLEEAAYRGGLGEGQEQIRGELAAYLSALARAEEGLAKIVKLNLEERRVRLQEAQITLMVELLDKVLRSPVLGLEPEKRKLARGEIVKELERRMSKGEA